MSLGIPYCTRQFILGPKISPENGRNHPLNYPDATVAQVDAVVEIKNPITKFPVLTEGKGF